MLLVAALAAVGIAVVVVVTIKRGGRGFGHMSRTSGKPGDGGSIGGSPAVNTVAPSISGTRGGTLTATPGTWTGATSVSGQWYADGAATGNTTTSFTDSDTSKSLEYRETALPGSVVASGYLGALATAPLYSDDFNSYADGTRLASRYNTTNTTTFTATATPHVTGWDGIGYFPNGDTETTGQAQFQRIYGGSVQQTYSGSSGNNSLIVHDFGSTSGIWDFTLVAPATLTGSGDVYGFAFSGNAPNIFSYSAILLKLWLGSSVGTAHLDLSGDGLTLVTVASNMTIATGDVLRVKVDATAKKLYFFYNGSVLGSSAGYDVSAFTGTWTGKAGILTSIDGTPRPMVGASLFTALAYRAITSNTVSAAINQQSGGSPGQKQIDITAAINAVGATGAQYKVETEAGQLVQNWTAMSFAGTTGTATYLIADHAYEGQKFRILVRNVGGTVNTAETLTLINGYVMSTPMQVGIGDNGWISYVGDSAGRDWFESREFGIIGIDHGSTRTSFNLPGLTVDNYNHWAEAYSPTQNYPDVSGHEVCRYQGLSWRTTDSTSKLRAAPNTANLSGAGGDWKLTGEAPADASLVGLTADGMPTKLPDDPNLTIFFQGTWTPPKARSDVGFTVACKTQPGIWVELVESLGTSRIDPASRNLTTGTFTITYDPTTFANYNGIFYVDRSKCTATLDSTFFLSGIPSYETGTPSADIGVPYASVDKLSDMAPFAGTRFMGALPIQRFAGGWNGTFTAANNTVSGSLRQWRHLADMANRLGWKYIWLNEPDGADSTYRTAMATFFRDNLNVGIIVILERSNEQWNNGAGGYQNAIDLLTRCNALAAGDAAKGFNYLLHCREHNAMVAVWKSVFGAAYASRVKPVLAWQSITSISQWQTMLDFENTWQNVGYVSIAPYVDGNIGTYNSGATGNQASMNAAILAGNQANFNTALSSYLTAQTDYEVGLCKAIFDFLPGYSMGKGLDKNAIQVGYYEAGFFAVNYGSFAALGAGCDTTAMTYFNAFKRSNTGIGAAFAYYIDQIRLKAPGPTQTFIYTARLGNLTTADSWGMMDGTGQTTQEPFATVKTKALAYNV